MEFEKEKKKNPKTCTNFQEIPDGIFSNFFYLPDTASSLVL